MRRHFSVCIWRTEHTRPTAQLRGLLFGQRGLLVCQWDCVNTPTNDTAQEKELGHFDKREKPHQPIYSVPCVWFVLFSFY